jgi:hypothetical protein
MGRANIFVINQCREMVISELLLKNLQADDVSSYKIQVSTEASEES